MGNPMAPDDPRRAFARPSKHKRRLPTRHAEAAAKREQDARDLAEFERNRAERPPLTRPRPWPRPEHGPKPLTDGQAELARDSRAGVFDPKFAFTTTSPFDSRRDR